MQSFLTSSQLSFAKYLLSCPYLETGVYLQTVFNGHMKQTSKQKNAYISVKIKKGKLNSKRNRRS